ncbi:MAG: alpha/beta-hydrolase family protein [Hydrogenovibrio sp.]|uniref:alpha/beta hydrolase n=1 Tax=Hydrogenovibrio sp. TaxID=2065821 RepID=UPI002870629A|nr:alpha/beta-hydrolase family protein [Hydrogenovibrio sp.]MDR9497656.1 alpha/beta-hydrolase family protein [Hydrogenovibrio sp.]
MGTSFFALSLTPSLVPRGETVQGVVSGLSMAAGYLVGVFGWWLWRYFELPFPPIRWQRVVKLVVAVLCGLLAISFLLQASEWQNTVRALMGMEKVEGVRALWVGLVAGLVFLAALGLGKLFVALWNFFSRHLRRVVPHRVSVVTGLLLSFSLFWAVVDGVLFATLLEKVDYSYQQVDALMDAEQPKPQALQRAGGPQSLIPWKTLGRQGRRYLASAPTAAEIAEFTQAPTQTPLRVYAGLNSADTPEARAELALAELERVGGFERSTLVLIVPTGTGWIDPSGVDTLEYLLKGDVASVAAQYSYLPSPVSVMADGDYAVENTRALFQAVYGRWRELPEKERPALYLFGLSLGAMNLDRSFDFFDIIDAPFDGALWVGPPFRMDTWREATQRRRPDSPQWLPRFRDDSVIRFANQSGGLDQGQAPWGDFRIAFLQYASDPITFFSPGSFYQKPAWLEPPRGPDVSSELRWFPIITMLQLAADMAVGKAPPGYGHEYAAEHYFDAWLALAEPEGWNDAELARLRAHFREIRQP